MGFKTFKLWWNIIVYLLLYTHYLKGTSRLLKENGSLAIHWRHLCGIKPNTFNESDLNPIHVNPYELQHTQFYLIEFLVGNNDRLALWLHVSQPRHETDTNNYYEECIANKELCGFSSDSEDASNESSDGIDNRHDQVVEGFEEGGK